MNHIAHLYTQARHESARSPAWDELRQAEAAELPTCVNHPGRATCGGFGDAYYCDECMPAAMVDHRLWLRSFGVVRGGVEGLRP